MQTLLLDSYSELQRTLMAELPLSRKKALMAPITKNTELGNIKNRKQQKKYKQV